MAHEQENQQRQEKRSQRSGDLQKDFMAGPSRLL
jgi:hypothetical protein